MKIEYTASEIEAYQRGRKDMAFDIWESIATGEFKDFESVRTHLISAFDPQHKTSFWRDNEILDEHSV